MRLIKAIPFFSIDCRVNDIIKLIIRLLFSKKSKSKHQLSKLIGNNFPEHEILLFPSARMAFYFTLEAQFKKGDEIIFPVLSFPLYLKIAHQLGLKVRLVDVEPKHLTMDPEQLKKKISHKTKGLVVTHLFGHPARMDEIMKIAKAADLFVIEDSAQSYDSFYKNQSTSTWADVGIFSCSLMKVPTTLGGGIFITRNQAIYAKISDRIISPDFLQGIKATFPFLIKNCISILNSYPLLYTILSHHIFGLIKKRDPQLLRKILYSGMGMNGLDFDVWERPKLVSYQFYFGLCQFSRTRKMTEKRRAFSKILDQSLEGIENVKVFREDENAYWNYQYHVIEVKDKMKEVFDIMFQRGFHLMQEDVWDCSTYGFIEGESTFPVGQNANKGLIRIPNNSLLRESDIRNMSNHLREVCSSL